MQGAAPAWAAIDLDALHEGGVEVVSPTFMNTRALTADAKIIPRKQRRKPATEDPAGATADDVAFAKANEAESLESMRERHQEILERVKESQEQLKAAETDGEKEALATRIEQLEKNAELLAGLITRREEELHSAVFALEVRGIDQCQQRAARHRCVPQ